MPLIETESLVLKSYNLAEADRIVVFLTRDHGIVRGVAKGAKRLKSKFGSTLEPFSMVHLSYFQKEDRELVSIQHAELLRSSFEAASDPAYLRTFSYISDILLSFVPPSDPNEKLYRMVKACIVANAGQEGLAAIRLYFEVWLLRLGGYLPEWSKCEICERKLEADETAAVQADFQLACALCRRSGGASALSGAQRDAFFQAQLLAPNEFIEYGRERPESITEVSSILKRIISTVIGREVASEKSFAVNF